jgi:hypothetical protein
LEVQQAGKFQQDIQFNTIMQRFGNVRYMVRVERRKDLKEAWSSLVCEVSERRRRAFHVLTPPTQTTAGNPLFTRWRFVATYKIMLEEDIKLFKDKERRA